ncbi:MAG: hypothetical protein KDF58_14490 [Alphaproteobacteria bacterium]|nr:hypothetical protein [Alphaproteobacteria bacterium]HPF46659.1 hypothetical protein [Emcibacteraceae bacterium]HRW29424.1 hypothetical protein [Emcibacteraceae bacterium]
MEKIEQFKKSFVSSQSDYEALLPLRYDFTYDTIPIACEILKDCSGNSYNIHLEADLGFLPYSAENKLHRAQILKELGPLMVQGKITIDHHCQLHMPIKTVLGQEISAKIIMEAILYTLLDTRKILEQIKSALGKSHPNYISRKSA